MSSKILLIDLETSPKTAFVWGRWKQNVAMNQMIQDTYVLNWSAKWLDDEYIYTDALPYHKKEYKADPTDDTAILETLWDLINEADILIAHNGDRFDMPTMNSRFIQKQIPPPDSYRTIDTLKIAKRKFRFTSNRLDDLGQFLDVGRKMDTGGFELWSDIVLKRCPKAWKHMIEYCEQDVFLLEAVYHKLAPWNDKAPAAHILDTTDKPLCNVCGSDRLHKNGTYATNTNTYQKFKCADCGHNHRSRTAMYRDKEEKKNILRSL
jgi:hypothetical protein